MRMILLSFLCASAACAASAIFPTEISTEQLAAKIQRYDIIKHGATEHARLTVTLAGTGTNKRPTVIWFLGVESGLRAWVGKRVLLELAHIVTDEYGSPNGNCIVNDQTGEPKCGLAVLVGIKPLD